MHMFERIAPALADQAFPPEVTSLMVTGTCLLVIGILGILALAAAPRFSPGTSAGRLRALRLAMTAVAIYGLVLMAFGYAISTGQADGLESQDAKSTRIPAEGYGEAQFTISCPTP